MISVRPDDFSFGQIQLGFVDLGEKDELVSSRKIDRTYNLSAHRAVVTRALQRRR